MEHRSFSTNIVVPDDDYSCGNKRAGELAPDVAPEELRKEKQVGGPVNCSDSELCTFLRALEEGFLPTYYSDTTQFVQLKSMSIASRSYQRGKKTVVFHGFPSLQMSRNLTEDRGAELLTWFLAGFRAKTLAAQTAKERVLTGPGRASGQKWRGLLAKFDRDSYSSRTAQGSSQGGSTECCATLPRWGSMRDGECLALTTPEHLTSETACGYWLPTPNASDHIQRKTSKSWAAKGRVNYVLSNPEITGVHGGRLNPEWTEWLMGWPLGWTDLKPLEMAKFREWQQQHGGC